MKGKKNNKSLNLSLERIRGVKRNKNKKIKKKIYFRKKICFFRKKLGLNNENSTEEKTNYSENAEDNSKESFEYYQKLRKIIEKLTQNYKFDNHLYDIKEKDDYFIGKINNIINEDNKRKINIILDIDQTLVYSQSLTDINDLNYINNLSFDKTDSHYIMFTLDNKQYLYYIQVRPGLKEFISKLSPYSNFFINSMANQNYVKAVLILLNQKYNLYLNDNGLNNVFITPANTQKTLPYEITKDGNFLILDDNIYAWDKTYLNNIIPVQKFYGYFNFDIRERNHKNETVYHYYFFSNKIYCINDFDKGYYDKINNLPFCCETSWNEINQLNYTSDFIIQIFILKELFKLQINFSFLNIINNILNDCYIYYEGEDEDFIKELIIVLGGNYIKDINKSTYILINNIKLNKNVKMDDKYNYINIKWLFDSYFTFVKREEKVYKVNSL